MIQSSGYRGETRITGELYEAYAQKLREFVGQLADESSRVLLIAGSGYRGIASGTVNRSSTTRTNTVVTIGRTP